VAILLKLLDRAVEWTLAGVRALCIAQATALFLVVVLAVIGRYVFGRSLTWTEEVPRYLLIWISFLGAAACVARREHVGFDVLFNALPAPVRRWLGAAIGALILAFGWIVFRYGIVFVKDFGPDMMETIPYTNYWYYVAVPISGALLLLFALRNIVDALLGRHESQIGHSVD
jgi:TRAP-type C4-dicarboxylate transport system permease small subunit